MLNEPINKEQIKHIVNFCKNIEILDTITDITNHFEPMSLVYHINIKGLSNGKEKIINYSIHDYEIYMYILELIDHLKRWSIWFNHHSKGYKPQ